MHWREEDRKLFPLTTVGGVVQLFRQQLTGDRDPDLVLLSVVTGFVENCMTNPKNITNESSSSKVTENDIVEDRRELRLEPQVELHIIEALCSKFESVIKGYCDLSLFREGSFATRSLVKRVSDIIWNTLSKSQYKDRAHLQSLYSYLTGNKLDCFGVAFAVVAGCQVLGFNDVHLALSEDHAWVVFGEDRDTAEVTWHGKGNEDKRGQPVEPTKIHDAWLYVGNKPVICSRQEEVAALVSSINFAISPSLDSLEVGSMQQELLWMLYDLGHLDKYPMALGNLADLEEIAPTKDRPACHEILDEALSVDRTTYSNHHVYPYTYVAGYRYRKKDFKGAMKAWAQAASVVKRYKYSKEDEEIYKEFMEINNDLIPHILKTEENLLTDPQCFLDLLQFYDGLCSWEEDSATPVLHEGWVKPMVKSFMSFGFNIRSKLGLTIQSGGNGFNTLSEHQQLQCVPDSFNNNYKKSIDEIYYDCDKICVDESIFDFDKNLHEENIMESENFEKMTENKLIKLVKATDCQPSKYERSVLLNSLLKRSSEKILNIEFLLGKTTNQPFLDVEFPFNFDTSCFESEVTNSCLIEDTKDGEKKEKKLNLTLHSVKMAALKDILQAERMNASALHLQLTAQTQTEAKKQRTSMESEGRAKRIRRE